MKRDYCLSLMMLALFGLATPFAADVFAESVPSSYTTQQARKITGKVVDVSGEPIIGASVLVKGSSTGTVTDIDGNFTVNASVGSILEISFIGYKAATVKVTSASSYAVTLQDDSQALDEVVVTAMGIKKEKKALGYAMQEVKSEELMKIKTANPISSLSGKVAGVNITQSSGAAGAGAQIILRGGTSGSEGKDNQPLFVVDGVIYDNSSSVIGNSAFDGSMRSASTSSNRVMDINPEDIENMSVLKGPAAAALYGSRAANGVILITTKKGKEGLVEVSVSSKFTSSWVKNLPKYQTEYARGYMEDQYDKDKKYIGTVFNDFSYSSWGEKSKAQTYDNIGNFFQAGNIFDESASVSGGTQKSKYYLSGSLYDQAGVVPETGYRKYAFRFNGEQNVGIFTFNANAAYSDAHTDRTLTGAGLYGSSGNGALYRVYNWSSFDDMRHYLNEDGSRYRMFGDRLDPWDEEDNPYWIVNKNHIYDNTHRFTGAISVKADIAKWWFLSYKVGLDQYTQTASNRLAANGVLKQVWQKGMLSDNSKEFRYMSHDFMSNMSKTFGDFDFNLLLGSTIDEVKTHSTFKLGYNFSVPDFFSYANATNSNKSFMNEPTKKRLVGLFGEFRASWKNMLYLTVSGRNDWTSTLPIEHRSYFYPSVSGSFVFTEMLQKLGWMSDDILNFGKIRASWAKVGKDTGVYETATSLWPVGTFLNNLVSVGNSWTRGNPYLKPEMTKSTEIGVELSFFKNRLHIDYAYYTNDSYNQILSPRGPQSTGYIFCSINAGNVYNKGMELSISGTPIQTKDFTWDIGFNMAGNRGTLDGLPEGMDVMYVTDVQYAGAQAASFNGGNFMAIAGTKWQRDEAGNVILDANGMPTYTSGLTEVGNRESKFTGGLNNTLTWKGLSFNMLWEYRVGGDVINGTKYSMDLSGVSQFSADIRNKPLTVTGVDADGNAVSNTWEADKSYVFNGVEKSGYNIIKDYYQNFYTKETRNYITKVNLLRLRSVSLSYEMPKKWLQKIGFVKRASVSASATNLLLFTNYDGDPEVAAAGAGVGGSSSVGFDYCGVPATSGMSFGLNLTF
ncbi:SusC/RagA family TonB-linked outer membrane protein [Bacteroides heparinolyticus]|uniref:SusC/RagA family TonB-linked outer membrane protein n=1 Tax=Prevotella heparinolytica TaxID=28113 RepID=UPI000D040795|nr:SusC/RagA family TonB-linked outer membrane protein [Bacteroides heparinolyticus]AVM58874.1 SusC/RagA family TonB-linked outer membrane protein [Bacteroides heparinolyticus]